MAALLWKPDIKLDCTSSHDGLCLHNLAKFGQVIRQTVFSRSGADNDYVQKKKKKKNNNNKKREQKQYSRRTFVFGRYNLIIRNASKNNIVAEPPCSGDYNN